MPTIRFLKKKPEVTVEAGANLMQALLDHQVPVASSCGGEGVCTKCLIKVIEGKENLSPPNETENDLREIHDFPKNERISCQTQVLGDITIDTTYW